MGGGGGGGGGLIPISSKLINQENIIKTHILFEYNLTLSGLRPVFLNPVLTGLVANMRNAAVLHRNIHLTLTLKSLCMIRLIGDDEVLINNRHRTFQPRTVRLRLLIYSSSSLFNLFMHKPFKVNVR